MNIKITGDLVINKSYTLDSDVIDFFKNSDLNIVNLEAPVTTTTSKIIKTGPHLKSDIELTRKILKELKVDLVTLANNHVLDYDHQGIKDTLQFCKDYDINTVGAGTNLENASKTFYFDTSVGKIGIVNFAENEWASATEKRAGANPMDIIDNVRQIKESKLKADYLFVIIHGGHEYYNLPSPRMQKQYRFYAECGADLVVGHHTHCISGFEVYKEVPIYYSLGNFLFTSDNKNDDWYTGMVLEIEIKDHNLTTKLFPVQQQKSTFGLSMLHGREKDIVLKRVSAYNKIISDKKSLYKEWKKLVDNKYNNYINRWSAYAYIKNRYVSGVLRRLGFTGLNIRAIAAQLNLMRCEAHADLSKEVTQKYLEDN
ncbi:CapA family protein [Eudoraea chungangensis]|uniref:CapA family protein n=1 Tax=Eudoraea chungangensis TaxID=1481905 RepID=UPI0023EB44B3|nr:CapA family protein [Eudoraea chungangensis]